MDKCRAIELEPGDVIIYDDVKWEVDFVFANTHERVEVELVDGPVITMSAWKEIEVL